MQFGLQGLPINAARLSLQLDAKPLQWLIEFTNGFLFVDALVALETFDTRVCSLSNRICKLRLAAARRAFEQQRLLELCRQVHGCRGNRIDYVPSRPKPFPDFVKR